MIILDMAPPCCGNMRPHRLKKANDSGGDDIRCVIRDFERDCHMGLGCKVVDFVGVYSVEPTTKRRRVREICIVELHSGFMGIVWVYINVVNPLSIEIGGPTNQPMYFIAFVEEEFSKIRTVLASYTGDQGDFRFGFAVVGSGGGGAGLV